MGPSPTAFLRGLSGAAADSSGVVWLSDLFGHVSREVPRLTKGRQHPHGELLGTNLPLFLVGENVVVIQALPQPSEMEQVVSARATDAAPEGGSKKWLWFGLALLGIGGGAAIGAAGGGGDGAAEIPPPPSHP